jgi:hypothetical protein
MGRRFLFPLKDQDEDLPEPEGNLLLEDGDAVLLETDDGIVLEATP